jgi:hypothetical protein
MSIKIGMGALIPASPVQQSRPARRHQEILDLVGVCVNRIDKVNFTFLESDFRVVDYKKIGKSCVYMFDGPHKYSDQQDGVLIPLPALDREYILIVDDWNWLDVRNATLDVLDRVELDPLFALEIRPTQDNTVCSVERAQSDWHNGYFIGVIRRN